MKKIIIGICGIGNGHVNRQKLIIDRLLEYKVDIVLAITQNHVQLLNNIYPDIKKIITYTPWIVYSNFIIDFEKTQARYLQDGTDYFNSFLCFAVEVKKAFNGDNPDYIITDYEPNAAQLAYAINKPLICFDQHAKFLNLSAKRINNFSIDEEVNKILYFFPRATKRYASSFFDIKNSNRYNIEVLPPIIKDIKKTSVKRNKVVVYFSPYTDKPNEYIKILELIKNYNDYEFNIYTELKFSNYHKYSHLHFKNINYEFDNDLSDCNFIISTAGHQLICEAIHLETPLYIFPLDTFDQNYCCYIVEKKKLGKKIIDYSIKEFNAFIANTDKYRSNIQAFKVNNKNWSKKWDEVLFEKLEKELGIEKKPHI